MEIKITYKFDQIMYDKNVSYRQLQQRTGISASYLNEIANNHKDTTVTNLCKIAAALKTEPEQLFDYSII